MHLFGGTTRSRPITSLETYFGWIMQKDGGSFDRIINRSGGGNQHDLEPRRSKPHWSPPRRLDLATFIQFQSNLSPNMSQPNITLYTTQTPNGIKISIALEELGYANCPNAEAFWTNKMTGCPTRSRRSTSPRIRKKKSMHLDYDNPLNNQIKYKTYNEPDWPAIQLVPRD